MPADAGDYSVTSELKLLRSNKPLTMNTARLSLRMCDCGHYRQVAWIVIYVRF